MNLSQIKLGQQALVTKVHGDVLALKLFEMGVLPGEQVELENIAPFGDPIAIRVGESKLCLRLEDAASIEIELR
ncbi:MAG: ferrous iron transport protein A [Bacteroidia bacterium]|jgi:ferrous iron transport protein A|nr:ferrous iron transport protein A [Bacteroidia bacterium]